MGVQVRILNREKWEREERMLVGWLVVIKFVWWKIRGKGRLASNDTKEDDRVVDREIWF